MRFAQRGFRGAVILMVALRRRTGVFLAVAYGSSPTG
jgi:hypothetical protein